VSRSAAAEKILAGTLSSTGERFKNLIAP
jgi:hypothetical protein